MFLGLLLRSCDSLIDSGVVCMVDSTTATTIPPPELSTGTRIDLGLILLLFDLLELLDRFLP